MKLYLAPLRGITGHIYRSTYVRYFTGIDTAVAPFIVAAEGRTFTRRHLRDLLPEFNAGTTVIPQVLSNNASQFLCMAQRVADLGYTDIDWNLGCPFAKVTDKSRGAGLLQEPDRIASILDEVVPRSPLKISVKTRLGFSSPVELERLVPIFNRYPLTRLTIHARTAAQMYEGLPDLAAFSRSMGMSKHPVVYNGNVNTPEDFAYIAHRFPTLEGVMLGRGAIADPFLPSRIKGSTEASGDEAQRVVRFLAALVSAHFEMTSGTEPVVGVMKEIWGYLADSLRDGAVALKKIQRQKSLTAYASLVGEVLTEEGAWSPRRGLLVVNQAEPTRT